MRVYFNFQMSTGFIIKTKKQKTIFAYTDGAKACSPKSPWYFNIMEGPMATGTACNLWLKNKNINLLSKLAIRANFVTSLICCFQIGDMWPQFVTFLELNERKIKKLFNSSVLFINNILKIIKFDIMWDINEVILKATLIRSVVPLWLIYIIFVKGSQRG